MGEVCECLYGRMKKRSVTEKGRGGKVQCAGEGLLISELRFYFIMARN